MKRRTERPLQDLQNIARYLLRALSYHVAMNPSESRHLQNRQIERTFWDIGFGQPHTFYFYTQILTCRKLMYLSGAAYARASEEPQAHREKERYGTKLLIPQTKNSHTLRPILLKTRTTEFASQSLLFKKEQEERAGQPATPGSVDRGKRSL